FFLLSTASSPTPFFFQPTPSPHIYPLSLHDALPISGRDPTSSGRARPEPVTFGSCQTLCSDHVRSIMVAGWKGAPRVGFSKVVRSEEHTSELQSRENLVCRLLLEKKKINQMRIYYV